MLRARLYSLHPATSVRPLVGPLFTFLTFLSFLSPLLLPKYSSDLLPHSSRPPTRDWGGRISGRISGLVKLVSYFRFNTRKAKTQEKNMGASYNPSQSRLFPYLVIDVWREFVVPTPKRRRCLLRLLPLSGADRWRHVLPRRRSCLNHKMWMSK